MTFSVLGTNVKVDANGDADPGVLMSAQTITSENNSTTTTTQITKVSEVTLTTQSVQNKQKHLIKLFREEHSFACATFFILWSCFF